MKGSSVTTYFPETDELIAICINSLPQYHLDPGSYNKYGKPSPQMQALIRVSSLFSPFTMVIHSKNRCSIVS